MVSNPFIMSKEFPPLVSIGQTRTLAIVYPHIQPKLEKYLKICQWLVEANFFNTMRTIQNNTRKYMSFNLWKCNQIRKSMPSWTRRLHHDFCNFLKFEMRCLLFTEINYCILNTDSPWLDLDITQIGVISIHCWMVHPGVIHEEQCDLEAKNIQSVILQPHLSKEQAEIQWFPSIARPSEVGRGCTMYLQDTLDHFSIYDTFEGS